MTALVLGLHRDYMCRHAGECCRSGWTIPIESPQYDTLAAAIRAGTLTCPGGPEPAPLLPFPARTGDYAGLLGTSADGCCAFLEHPGPPDGLSPSRPGCAVHRQLGHAALPRSCQQFPRIAVMRPASTAVSLSHYCPTAAALLFGGTGTLAVEEAPATLWEGYVWEGLDLRDSLPPLLRHDALFSWTTFDLWERFVIAMLADRSRTLDDALVAIAAAAEALREWNADAGPMEAFAERCLSDADGRAHDRTVLMLGADHALDAVRIVSSAIPPGVPPPPTLEAATSDETGAFPSAAADNDVMRRYVAGRAWGSWVAHESGGVRGYVRWLLVVLGTLRAFRAPSLAEAIRRADLLLLHLASPAAIARTLARADTAPLEATTLTPTVAPIARSRWAGRKPRVPVK